MFLSTSLLRQKPECIWVAKMYKTNVCLVPQHKEGSYIKERISGVRKVILKSLELHPSNHQVTASCIVEFKSHSVSCNPAAICGIVIY